MRRLSALPPTIILLAFVSAAGAQGPYDDERTPEGWAWKQIRNDQIVDFGVRCGIIDPHTNQGWNDHCRQISPQFLIDVLTVPKWRDQVVRHRVRLRAARIEGTVDLSDNEITSEVWIDASKIDGDLILFDTHWDRPLSLRGSTLAGKLLAERMHAESIVALQDHAVVKGEINLKDATIGVSLDLEGSTFVGAVNADGINVAALLGMGKQARFLGEVSLAGAKIGRDLDTQTSSFARAVNFGSLRVEGSLFMRSHTTFDGDVILKARASAETWRWALPRFLAR
jgi:hypothetical protein